MAESNDGEDVEPWRREAADDNDDDRWLDERRRL